MKAQQAFDIEFVGLASATALQAGHGTHPCQGLYYTPRGVRPKVALIATHYNVDFMEHYLAPYAVERGYGFLGWNTRFRGAEDLFVLEHALIDIGTGTRWLKEHADVETIVLLGNSGGSSLMAAYQGEATAPTMAESQRGPARDALATLIKGEAFVSLNAHLGRPEVITDWMDGSVTDEWDLTAKDPTLDPFDPTHGPPFSDEFIARYRQAQRDRNQRITDWAKAEKQRLGEAGIADRIFSVSRVWADLRFIDPAIDPSDRQTPLCYRGVPDVANKTFGIARSCSIAAWLSMWSLETSRCQSAEHMAKFDVPALVVQGTADNGVFPSDAKRIFDQIAVADKQLEMVPGGHYFEDSEASRRNAATIIFDWLDQRIKS